ncbi:MAG: radical SAM protein [Candidatus Omnitrophica bacterium]|nr:radical SAM protein [Candidatus Omnitrophota bacterium]
MLKGLKLNLARYLPALLDTIEYKPSSLTISLTSRCNCRCVMCGYRNIVLDKEMPADQVKDILAQAKALGVKDCVLYGGEPLLRNDIYELVSFSRALGLTVTLITNGTLLDKERSRRLLESGPSRVIVSLDMLEEKEVDRIRGIQGAYKKAYQGVLNLLEFGKDKEVKINIAAILMLANLREERILKLIEDAKKLNVPVIIQLPTFTPYYFKTVDDQIKKELWINQEHAQELNHLVEKLIAIKRKDCGLIVNSFSSLRSFPRYFLDSRAKGIPCYIAFSGRIWVNYSGEVFLCQSMPALGDLNKNKLAQIIASPEWRRMLHKMFRKQCLGCSCMYDSNIDAHFPIAWQELLKNKLKI